MEEPLKYRSAAPEYLRLFSNSGDVVIKVKFTDKRDKGRLIRSFKAQWSELSNLIDPDTGEHYTAIYIDSYHCPIAKLEVDPRKKIVTIHIGDTSLPSPDAYDGCTPIVNLRQLEHHSSVQICCKVTALKEMFTKAGNLMGWATVEDVTGSVEVIVFPDNYMDVSELLKSDELLLIHGKVDEGDHSPKILLESVTVTQRQGQFTS